MNDTFSFTLEGPLTKEQINLITDAEFEHTDRIWFDTPKGKHIEFVKAPQWIPCSERLPEDDKDVLISYRYKEDEGDTNHIRIDITSYGRMYFGGRKIESIKHWRPPFEYFESNYEVIAWMPLPKPYEEVEQ